MKQFPTFFLFYSYMTPLLSVSMYFTLYPPHFHDQAEKDMATQWFSWRTSWQRCPHQGWRGTCWRWSSSPWPGWGCTRPWCGHAALWSAWKPGRCHLWTRPPHRGYGCARTLHPLSSTDPERRLQTGPFCQKARPHAGGETVWDVVRGKEGCTVVSWKAGCDAGARCEMTISFSPSSLLHWQKHQLDCPQTSKSETFTGPPPPPPPPSSRFSEELRERSTSISLTKRALRKIGKQIQKVIQIRRLKRTGDNWLILQRCIHPNTALRVKERRCNRSGLQPSSVRWAKTTGAGWCMDF